MTPITFVIRDRTDGRLIGEIVHDGRNCSYRCMSDHHGDRAFFKLVQLPHPFFDKHGGHVLGAIHDSLESCYFLLTDRENQEKWGVEVIPSRHIERHYKPLAPGCFG